MLVIAACAGSPAAHTSATPLSTIELKYALIAQLDVPPEVMTRVEHHYYDAGHMMYTREPDLKKLKQDVAAWLAA